jgi:hypothetical protein
MTNLLEALRDTSDNISLLHRSITSVDFSVLSEEEKDEIKTMLQNIVSLLEFLSTQEDKIQ